MKCMLLLLVCFFMVENGFCGPASLFRAIIEKAGKKSYPVKYLERDAGNPSHNVWNEEALKKVKEDFDKRNDQFQSFEWESNGKDSYHGFHESAKKDWDSYDGSDILYDQWKAGNAARMTRVVRGKWKRDSVQTFYNGVVNDSLLNEDYCFGILVDSLEKTLHRRVEKSERLWIVNKYFGYYKWEFAGIELNSLVKNLDCHIFGMQPKSSSFNELRDNALLEYHIIFLP